MKIVTGIFWVVRGEIIADKFNYEIDNSDKDFLDYPYSHFDRWENLSKNRFPYSDFATFPRGRLLFCFKEGRYYLYLDRCITLQQTEKILVFYGLKKSEVCIARDEHYSCDKCCKKLFKERKNEF